MKAPTNMLGLPGTDMDPAHMDTKRIMPHSVLESPKTISTKHPWIALYYR